MEALVKSGTLAAAAGNFVSAESCATALLDGPGAGNPQVRAWALYLRGSIASHTAKPEAAARLLEQAVAEAQEAGDSWCVANALCSFGRAHMYAGNHRPARTCFAGALEVAADAGDQSVRAGALLGLGWVYLIEATYHQAKVMFVEAKAVAREIGDKLNESEALTFLAEVAKLQGEPKTAEESLQEGLALAEESGSLFHAVQATAGLARVAQEQGKPQDAAGLFEKAIVKAREAGLWFILVRALMGRSRALIDLRQPEAAARLLKEALDVARDKEDSDAIGTAIFALGRLARARGAEEEAVDLHHQAMVIRNQIGHREGLADSLEALAGHLAKNRASTGARLLGAAQSLRSSGDEAPSVGSCPCCRQDRVEVKKALAGEDFQQAVRQGSGLSADEAVVYASRGRGPRHNDITTGWDSLSPTECMVADLVLEGLSNPEIGERLFVSRRTAGSHLTHIYKKLGVVNRRELREAFRERAES